MSGLEAIKKANDRYPATTLVWAAVAIAGVVAFVSALQLGWLALAFGVVFVLVSIFVIQICVFLAYG